MSINFQHPEYEKYLPEWQMVENICESSNVEQYLIPLNPADNSEENRARNEAYRKRAVLYPVAGHTLQGLIGLMFSKDPQLVVPQSMDYMLTNCDGSGVSIYQQSQCVAEDVMRKGRVALFVTYPKTTGPVSREQINNQQFVATIHEIDAEQVINWRTKTIGSKTILELVVIREYIQEVQADGYEVKEIEQLRELALVDGIYTVREWRKNDKDEWITIGESRPTDAAGKLWTEIPFIFVGSISNTPEIDEAPIYPLAKINVAHYRNSADYEDSVWYVGQAQPWMSGITQNHVDLMKSNNMYVGSRNLLGVPSGERFEFASAPPNPLVRQAMLDKLEMMIGLGARFIQGQGQVKTATEASNDAKSQYSSLALVAGNISEAYTKALEFAGRYMGDNGEATYQISKDFISLIATAQDIQAIVAAFVQGAIPMGDYFRWLKKVDLVDGEKTIEQFAEEVGKTQMPNLEQGNQAA